jgi:peptidoglycan-associated lipoprotein
MMNKKVVGIAMCVLLSACCTKKINNDVTGAPIDTNVEDENNGPLKNIYFNFDSSELSAASKETLKNNVEWLKANASNSVEIQGNCDERGTDEYNLALGERRAKAAQKFMKSLGVEDKRMSTVSYGENKPAVDGHDEAAWAKNRRDAFKVK